MSCQYLTNYEKREIIVADDKANDVIWEKRYQADARVAKWPFDLIVSMIMRRFSKVEQRAGIKILDYGCGGGNNFWFLKREGFDGYACDIAQSALDITERKIASEGIEISSDRFVLIDGKTLPFEDDLFDAIIDRESLCQSPWIQIEKNVQEFNRILKPGGSYFGINFTDHHPDARYGRYQKNGDWNNFSQGLFKDQGHRHLFSLNELVGLFNENWEIDSIREHSLKTVYSGPERLSDREEISEYVIVAHTKNDGR